MNNLICGSSKIAQMRTNTVMKSITTATATVIALILLGAAPTSEARCSPSSRTYISGHRSCGTPIYTQRYFVGYDRCGHEVWGTRVVRSPYRRVVRQRHVVQRPNYYQQQSYRYGSPYRGARIEFRSSHCD